MEVKKKTLWQHKWHFTFSDSCSLPSSSLFVTHHTFLNPNTVEPTKKKKKNHQGNFCWMQIKANMFFYKNQNSCCTRLVVPQVRPRWTEWLPSVRLLAFGRMTFWVVPFLTEKTKGKAKKVKTKKKEHAIYTYIL